MLDLLKTDYIKLLKAKAFKPLQPRKRTFIGCGQSSIAISDTHHELLLVTNHKSARNIEPFTELMKVLKDEGTNIPLAIILPQAVGYHLELDSLMDHDDPNDARKALKERTESLNTHIWRKNVVYSMEKFDGSVECFYKMRFRQDTIDLIMTELKKALEFMHNYGFTHNDIAERNIFYKGQYPNITIGLGDFGSCTYNPVVDGVNLDLRKHHEKSQLDFLQLNRVRERLTKLLESKQSPDKRLAQLGNNSASRPRRTSAVKCLHTMLDMGIIQTPELVVPLKKAKTLVLSPDKKSEKVLQKSNQAIPKPTSIRKQVSRKK